MDEKGLVAAVPWYPLAGLAVGFCAVLLPWAGVASAYPQVQGWMYVLISLWATRGLHWDGLADVADAWGSGRQGAEFCSILKDSRIGAFGALALIAGLAVQSLLAGIACAAERWDALLLAPVAGRAAAPVLAATCLPHPDSKLGRLVIRGSSIMLALVLVCSFVAICSFVFSLAKALALTAGLTIILYGLQQIARRAGGMSGDFFGTTIVLTETVVLAACL